MEKNTKQRLMEAAIELFSVKGFSGTGVDEIAGAIGLKGPNLYKYYKGKDDLLTEIVKRADEEYEKGMEAGITALENIHSGKELRTVTLQIVEFTINNEMAKKMRRIFTIEQYRDDMFARMATKHQLSNSVTVHERIFKRLIKEGIMIKGDPAIYALEFASPVTLMIQLADRDPEQKAYALKTIRKHVLTFIDRYFLK